MAIIFPSNPVPQPPASPVSGFNLVPTAPSYLGYFQDLIIIFWDEKSQPEEDFWTFANLVEKSRYHSYRDQAMSKQIVTLQVADGIKLAWSMIEEWANVPKYRLRQENGQDYPLTIYLGFQRDWYTRDDFFDILRWSEQLPESLGFTVKVSWLANDWFDSPGMLPHLTNGQSALEWMEEQNKHHKEEQITYDFKGVHHEPVEPPF